LRRKCLLKYIIEGEIEGTGRWRRRHKQLLDDLKGARRCRKLKEEALDHTLRRTRFGRDYGPVVRQTTWLIDWLIDWYRAEPVFYLTNVVFPLLSAHLSYRCSPHKQWPTCAVEYRRQVTNIFVK
jgi:hypothetical protein